jgi:hypothetical protein
MGAVQKNQTTSADTLAAVLSGRLTAAAEWLTSLSTAVFRRWCRSTRIGARQELEALLSQIHPLPDTFHER